MSLQPDHMLSDPNLLRVLIELNQWEDCQCPQLHTMSGRDLYYRVAAGMLADSQGKPQPLKLLSGRVTDRATRNRMRDFEAMGLVDVVGNEFDARTKRVIPTGLLVERVNQHVHLFKRLCNQRFLMVARS